MRMACATIAEDQVEASTYVDDPIISLVGTRAEQDLAIGQCVGSLLAMGFELAFAKAQDSAEEDVVTWISGRLQILHDQEAVAVEIKEEILAELKDNVVQMLKANHVKIEALRELAGRANCVASLLHTWRPFVAMLWAPIYSTKSRTPFDPTKVWLTAVQIPLDWLMAFLSGTSGTLRRVYTLAAYLGEGDQVQIVTDASPVGLGAYLKINGVIQEFAFGDITQRDQDVLQVAAGGSEGQQVWEALIILSALRLWRAFWRERRVSLLVRSDSVSALILVIKCKTSGYGTSVIARETALDIADALYAPNIAKHMIGITNLMADYLSQMQQHQDDQVPGELRNAVRRELPERDATWWRTVKCPRD